MSATMRLCPTLRNLGEQGGAVVRARTSLGTGLAHSPPNHVAHPEPQVPSLAAPGWRCPKTTWQAVGQGSPRGPGRWVPATPSSQARWGGRTFSRAVWSAALPATRPVLSCYPTSGRPPGGEGPGLCHSGSLSPRSRPSCSRGPGQTSLLRLEPATCTGRPGAGPSRSQERLPLRTPSMSGLSVGYLPSPAPAPPVSTPAVRPVCPGHPLNRWAPH